MELQRQEYPAMLSGLQPPQAVRILNDRLHHIRALNADVADWFQERRRIEEAYVSALQRLASKPLSQDNLELGDFSTPWQKLISSTQVLAQNHQTFAHNIETDVERPLREFNTSRKELQSVTRSMDSMQKIIKDMENAHKKADQLKHRGGRANVDKVATAASSMEDAQGQWDSQAPFVFESLQVVDEARLDHLRGCLTQFQTFSSEVSTAVNSAAEESLNALLNWQTSVEIEHFTLRAPTSISMLRERRKSQPPPPSSVQIPTTLAPPLPVDEVLNQRTNSLQERRQSRLSLRRFKTVLKGGRKEPSHPYGQPLSPDKRASATNLSKFTPFGKKSRETPNPIALSPQPTGNLQLVESHHSTTAPISEVAPVISLDALPSAPIQPAGDSAPLEVSELVNGTHGESPKAEETLQTVPETSAIEAPQNDERPAPVLQGSSAIDQALAEAALVSDSAALKVDIRNAPIQEEDGDATAALALVANTLRQATPRRSGTQRGRRDRSTILVPSPSVPELSSISVTASASSSSLPIAQQANSTVQQPSPALQQPSPALQQPSPSLQHPSPAWQQPSPAIQPSPIIQQPSPVVPQVSPAVQPTPFKLAHRSTLGDETAASDTHSIRSGRSLSSSVSATIRHPELLDPGLSASIVETVSAWFSAGKFEKAIQIGEVALAYNSSEPPDSATTETIRFNNFSSLEKVAPNPHFIDPVPDKEGSYSVNLSRIHKTSVAFKYQVNLGVSGEVAASHAPLRLMPAWKVESAQAFLLLHYSLNPAFAVHLPPGDVPLSMTNVILIAHLDPAGGRALRCNASGGGVYARERSLVYWRLGDVSLPRDGSPLSLRARFATDGEARPGLVEARWEVGYEQFGGAAAAAASGVGLSRLEPGGAPPSVGEAGEAADPFADEGSAVTTPTATWKDVKAVRKLRSGTYAASV